MAHAALFDLLPDFGAGMARAVPATIERQHAPQPVDPPLDVEAIVARAVAEAKAATEARLTLAHEAAMEAEREANAAEAKAFLESLGDDVGKTVASHIEAMEAHVGDLVGATVGRIVGGLLSEDLQKRSLEALARAIRESIGDTDAVRVSVRGPQSMFETLKTALGPHAGHLDFTDAPGFDLTVVVDDAVLETRMAEWAAALAEVLA
jgi:hypothetical protein